MALAIPSNQMSPIQLSDRFEILRSLARGGMGEVSVAYDQERGDTCCIKSLPLDEEQVLIQRFMAEAGVLVGLQHPHVVPVRAYGKDDTQVWYAMDRMQTSLHSRRRHAKRIDAMQAVDWMLQALAGLEALHRRGIVHRDVKLANLLLDANGTVHVADLGLARHPKGTVPFRTKGERGLGTPDYAAPELFRDAAHADRRADLFSVAVCFFELVTGQPPARFVLHPIEPRVLDAVPPPFVVPLQIIGAPRAEHRYETATAVVEALCRAVDEWAQAQGETPMGRPWMKRFEAVCPPLGLQGWWKARLWHWGLR